MYIFSTPELRKLKLPEQFVIELEEAVKQYDEAKEILKEYNQSSFDSSQLPTICNSANSCWLKLKTINQSIADYLEQKCPDYHQFLSPKEFLHAS